MRNKKGQFIKGSTALWKGKTKEKFPELYENRHTGRYKEERIEVKCANPKCNNKIEHFNHKSKENRKYCSMECCGEARSKMMGKRHKNGSMLESHKKSKATKKELFDNGLLNSWNKGLTKETNEILARTAIKISKKQVEAMKSGKYSMKPNKKEIQLDGILKELNKPYKFVGDGKFWIENMNPDFVNVNGRKHVIDLFGCYWHGCPKCFPDAKVKQSKEEDYRKKRLAEYGYESDIIWEHELEDVPQLLQKIKKI